MSEAVDYEDIGDNYILSRLSRGYCQDARITFGPLREGCARDMSMMDERGGGLAGETGTKK